MTLFGRGRQSGIETNWTIWHLWTIRGGEVVRGQGFTDRESALEAAGSAWESIEPVQGRLHLLGGGGWD